MTTREPVRLDAMVADADGDPVKLVALLRSSGAIGAEAGTDDVAGLIRAVLDAVPPDTTPADAGTRARLAAIADQFG